MRDGHEKTSRARQKGDPHGNTSSRLLDRRDLARDSRSQGLTLVGDDQRLLSIWIRRTIGRVTGYARGVERTNALEWAISKGGTVALEARRIFTLPVRGGTLPSLIAAARFPAAKREPGGSSAKTEVEGRCSNIESDLAVHRRAAHPALGERYERRPLTDNEAEAHR
jgi:hypothetical protein